MARSASRASGLGLLPALAVMAVMAAAATAAGWSSSAGESRPAVTAARGSATVSPGSAALSPDSAELPPDSTARPGRPAAAPPLVLRRTATVAPPAGGPGSMVSPAGVAVDAFGRLHVADGALHRLLRFDSNGDWLGESGALGSGAGQFRRPGSVVAAGALLIAVLDIENRRIASYDLFGRLQGIAVDLGGDAVSAAAGRVDPVALAADRGGALYVADANQDRILVFDPAGRLSRTVGRFGDGAGAFRGLAGLAVTRAGEIVATEREGARVQRLDPSGRPLAAWPLAVRAAGASLPVAVDDSLRVAVADGASGRLWLFDRHGRVLAARDGLAAPGALAFAADGALWVAEAGAGRVTRWLPEPRGEEPLEPGAR